MKVSITTALTHEHRFAIFLGRHARQLLEQAGKRMRRLISDLKRYFSHHQIAVAQQLLGSSDSAVVDKLRQVDPRLLLEEAG